MESLTFQNGYSTNPSMPGYANQHIFGNLPFAYTFQSSRVLDGNLQKFIKKELPPIFDSIMSNIRYDSKVNVRDGVRYIKKLGNEDPVMILLEINDGPYLPPEMYIKVSLMATSPNAANRLRDTYKNFIQDEILKKLKIAYAIQNKKIVTAIKDVSPNTDIARNIATLKGDLPKVQGLDIGQGRKRKTRKHRSRKVKKTRKH